MLKLLPDQVKELWQRVDQDNFSSSACYIEQERLLDTYRSMWNDALRLENQPDLQHSMLWEIGQYINCDDMAEIRNRCQLAVPALKAEWQNKVGVNDRKSVEQFYDESHTTIYELMWWHTLTEDSSPLAYVTALEFARNHGCQQYLDFGAGVGSGGILFARDEREVTLADISSPLQRFSQWRLMTRTLPAKFIDLKRDSLPRHAFDLVTALDVFEHLVDPVETIEQLSDALQPGGFLFARLASEIDEDRPQHIVQDFRPTFACLQRHGFKQVWEDDWLWGHVVFQKP
ncbi:class I SAM-dependent methyltransferase [Nitrospira sp. M1]